MRAEGGLLALQVKTQDTVVSNIVDPNLISSKEAHEMSCDSWPAFGRITVTHGPLSSEGMLDELGQQCEDGVSQISLGSTASQPCRTSHNDAAVAPVQLDMNEQEDGPPWLPARDEGRYSNVACCNSCCKNFVACLTWCVTEDPPDANR